MVAVEIYFAICINQTNKNRVFALALLYCKPAFLMALQSESGFKSLERSDQD
jgi:hypothetical protein